MLKSHVPTKVKRIIETSWSARYDAVNAIRSDFAEVFESLEKVTGAEENADTRSSAGIIMHSITTFPFLYLGLWGKILPEVNGVQKYLQTKGLGLDRAVDKIQVLQKFLDDERYWLVNEGIVYATTMCDEMEITITRRIRKRKQMDGDVSEELTFQEELRRKLFEVVDRLRDEINRQFNSYTASTKNLVSFNLISS